MLVMDVFDDEETTNIVDDNILVSWVVVHSILEFAIVPNRMLQLQEVSWGLSAV